MKIVSIAFGSPIPPTGWGAVESLIWDTKTFIDKYHPEFQYEFVNTNDDHEIVTRVNSMNPDVIHIHNDRLYLVPYFECNRVFMTSHWAYLDQIHKRTRSTDSHHIHLMNMTLSMPVNIICLSQSIKSQYIRFGCDPQRLSVLPNGVNDEIFRFSQTPEYPERSVYLGRIEPRKRQVTCQNMEDVYFIGNYESGNFAKSNPRWLGELSRDNLYDKLTDYGNLILLSDGEAHALVCAESLVCGLGLVVSEHAAANLDTSLPFIDVIPDDLIEDTDYIAQVIRKNRQVSVNMRDKIREYAKETFGLRGIVNQYISIINKDV